jgi:hypothetical protein
MGRWWRSTIGIGALLMGTAIGCGDADEPKAADPGATPSQTSPSSADPSAADGYVVQVNARCRELLTQVMGFDIGNAVTIEQFLGKHEQLVVAIKDFDADVDAIPVTATDRPAADAFDAYRRFSDTADATVVAAAETGDQKQFDAANAAFLELIHGGVAEIDAMHAAGIQCNAR